MEQGQRILVADVNSSITSSVNAMKSDIASSGTAKKWDNASKTVSTANPSGGNNGDIWFQYI